MILTEFSKYLQTHNEEFLTHKSKPIDYLGKWIEEIVSKQPKNNVEKIIHKEILYCKNTQNEYMIIGKSDSGRILVKALIEFAKSYDNYNQAKWLDITEKSLKKDSNDEENCAN